MTLPRSKIVDPEVTRWYHCISRCVRQAFLLSNDSDEFHRKDWLESRLRELDSIFAVSVAGYSFMDNHLHLLLRIEPDIAKSWSPVEVARRWLTLYPPRVNRKKVVASQEDIERLAQNTEWVEEKRNRLVSLGWFMKCLKEPLARLANREEHRHGTFFEGRFKSIAILDEESILTVAAYIDLNPVAARICSLPEQSPHTSIHDRVEHVVTTGRVSDVQQIRNGSVPAQQVSEGLEDDHWLIPIEDRRAQGASREGIQAGFTLGQYLMLVDCMSRCMREGKAHVEQHVASIFDRIAMDAQRIADRVQSMLQRPRFYGSFLAATREGIRRAAARLGVNRLVSTA